MQRGRLRQNNMIFRSYGSDACCFPRKPPAAAKPPLCFPRNKEAETYSASVVKTNISVTGEVRLQSRLGYSLVINSMVVWFVMEGVI